MRTVLTIAVFVCLAATASAQDRPVSNGAQLDAHLARCFRPPVASTGSEITLVFSLDQNGALRGKPRISHSKLLGDSSTQRAFVAAALRMLQDCTPVRMTTEFGLVAANKMRAWRLTSAPPARPSI